jgi:hypothetical protein
MWEHPELFAAELRAAFRSLAESEDADGPRSAAPVRILSSELPLIRTIAIVPRKERLQCP